MLRLLSCLVLLVVGCGGPGNDVDYYGPPAGFGIVEGLVRYDRGDAVPGVEVIVGSCESSIGALASSSSSTDSTGWYEVGMKLPPGDALGGNFIADTVTASCEASADRDSTSRVPVEVPFARSLEEATSVRVDITIVR
jgi:hypothetical protein